jgi:hypothetical protein
MLKALKNILLSWRVQFQRVWQEADAENETVGLMMYLMLKQMKAIVAESVEGIFDVLDILFRPK